MNTSKYAPAPVRGALTPEQLAQVFADAAAIDGTLATTAKQRARLAAKEVVPERYTQARLFENMARCQPSLFQNYPVQRFGGGLEGSGPTGVPHLIDCIARGFPQVKRARLRRGRKIEYYSLRQVMDRWLSARSKFGVIDLHYIGTRFDSWVDTKRLNAFNLLSRGTDSFESQDSMVISSGGAFTDAHSDDHSGSNHCFAGSKVWVLWDTQEGLAHGIEDEERCPVEGRRCAFDLDVFLTLKTAHWLHIGPGQTMFIPAHLSHKVITLERYLGLGSFHAGLPGFVDLLTRWRDLPPLWTKRASREPRRSVAYVTDRALRKLARLRTADRQEQARWGLPQLVDRLKQPDVQRGAVRERARSYPELEGFLRGAGAFL